MAPFPAPVTHWHLSTPHNAPGEKGRFAKEEAREHLRSQLVADHQATRDPAYVTAIKIIDAGWDAARVGNSSYVAYGCACPLNPEG